MSLTIVATHPVQYYAPIFRYLNLTLKLPTNVIYGSDFSIRGYQDKDFQECFSWDTDLLSGYHSSFLESDLDSKKPSMSNWHIAGLGKALLKSRPRAVMVLGYAQKIEQMAIMYSVLRGYPLILRQDVNDEALKRSWPKAMARQIFLKMIYAKAATLLPIGKPSERHYFHLKVPRRKIIYSANCIDMSSFKADENARSFLRNSTRNSLEVSMEDVLILFSGKLIEKKNPAVILESVAMLPNNLKKKITVGFLGSGRLKEKLQSLSSSLKVSVRFIGFKNQTELSPYYHAADLLVLPSGYGETWGLVVNEALAHGTPCVVSNLVGSREDLICGGRTGEVFEVDRPESLKDALERIFRYIKLDETREYCRKQVEPFSIENAALGILRAYEYAVSAGRPGIK